MKGLPDSSARLRVLTELDSTLLVEAAAGTGKTSLIAGRIIMLLAGGADPGAIAAITFTVPAASALSARVHHYIDELLAGRVPKPLQLALPCGLDPARRSVLAAAASRLGSLTTATIHGFCQNIIGSYAVEANIDPGAHVLDAAQARAVFDSVFERWLKRRLTEPARADDPLTTLSRDNPREVVSTLQKLARFRLKHRTARPPAADLSGRPDIDLIDAVAAFQRWIASQPPEAKTREIVDQLGTLADFYSSSFNPEPDFPRLWALAHPPRLPCMRKDTYDLIPPRRKTPWEKIAGKERGAQLNDEATQHFAHADRCYRTLLGRIATALVAGLSAELDEVLSEYATFKRAAAVLDFEDLLERAQTLVRRHDAVRRALGERYRYIFVDEFQDTDPVQAEILFLIAAARPASQWEQSTLRPAALFMVGDPKQAIYRFRGADVSSYQQARAAIERHWPGNIVQITANFRSRPAILDHVNRCFEAPLSGPRQPSYVALAPTLEAADGTLPCVARIEVDTPLDARSDHIRDAEAEAVAALCAQLIGNMRVRDESGSTVALSPGGIALLAPTGTELWRYERALEAQNLPIASQAGKGFFRRQEVQDLLALCRVLSDAGDRLAFGALMRGPLVGLFEEELLDITAALPHDPDRPDEAPHFSLLTKPDEVAHPVARQVLSVLQDLKRRAGLTTPMQLLAEAIDRLSVRSILKAREGDRSARAIANVELFLERARAYGVRGLKQFVRDVGRDWKQGAAHDEGRVDAEEDAIEIITIHSSKGLEWPVVIPINTVTLRRSRETFVHRASDDTVHWILGEAVPPGLLSALDEDKESAERERERLWYVACTRARDLLIIPELRGADAKSWARVIDHKMSELLPIDLASFNRVDRVVPRDAPNTQTAEVFASERASISAASIPLTWVRPSDRDEDRLAVVERIAIEADEMPEAELPIGAGRIRGLLLHKLMEEVLTGEVEDDLTALARRADFLARELGANNNRPAPDSNELAATIRRTLQLSEIAECRSRLIPEVPVYGMLNERTSPTALAGRVDAVAHLDDGTSIVFDWKSDITLLDEDFRAHAGQLKDYLRVTRSARGALVYMTHGIVRWVDVLRGE